MTGGECVGESGGSLREIMDIFDKHQSTESGQSL